MKGLAVELAKKAGSLLLQGFKSKTRIGESKAATHLVTEFDLESERIIIGGIKKKYPGHSILSEEAGFIENSSSYTWIVDPLDGTRNFTQKNPFFSISIALKHESEILFGVVYAPVLDELFVAEKGRGAFLNDTPISVSSTQGLGKASVVMCEGSDRKIRRSVKLYQEIRPVSLDMKKLGSAAIESAWVSCGRAEAYITTKINPWDVAAGVLLVEEAGGRVTDFKGQRWNFQKSDLLFSNGKIHNQLLQKINDCLKS
ncbi:MAG TPA: inositol monophosphatase family protein [Thermodesulfobacteriota bacterium]|nr:inositol monophosphatase family protein [Thermodesulfobacteriota bacterium]